MYQTCACVIHIYLHTLSAACALVLSSYINVCAGYMCREAALVIVATDQTCLNSNQGKSSCSHLPYTVQAIGSSQYIVPPGVTLPKHPLTPYKPPSQLTNRGDFLYTQSRKCRSVLGDGNCLFRVVSHQLYDQHLPNTTLTLQLH